MTAEERSLLEALDAIVGSEEIRAQIYPIVERVRTELVRNKKAQMTWEPIPLTIYGGALPSGIRSSWVFVLRAGSDHGSRTPSEQSSTDDVVRSGWRFASPSRTAGRRRRAVAVQSFGE